MAGQDFTEDFAWSNKFLRPLMEIAAQNIGKPVTIATPDQDQRLATDLIAGPWHVACRVRKAEDKNVLKYWNEWRDEFTLRSDRLSGAKTELEKIREGHGDYFIYAFGNSKLEITRWTIGKLDAFRVWTDPYERSEVHNKDGSSFMTFRWDEIPGFIVGASYLWF